jgi:predicted lipoprotein with Yx(FWY)xxD motif
MKPTHRRRRHAHKLAILVAVAAVLVLISACGGSSGGSSSNGGGGSTGPATVKTASISGYGSALVTNAGVSVYMLSSDPPGASKCSGTCAKQWKPVTVSGSASAGSGVDASKLSTFKRSDGTTQVLYDKHALYTFASPGATSGEGVKGEGGSWYLVAPSGKPITSTKNGHSY